MFPPVCLRTRKRSMTKRFLGGSILQWLVVVVSLLIVVVVIILQQSSLSFEGNWHHYLPKVMHFSPHSAKMSSMRSAGVCGTPTKCSAHQISFYLHSGAANVIPPAICVQNKLVLGTALNNAGGGINIVILNGKTGEVLKTDHYNMYSGDVKPFTELLQSLERGSIVIMASYDEPSTKLNEELKNLIADLGSSHIHSLGYRDNWVFVGGKGVMGKSTFEKYMKSDSATNKYEGWPEMIGLDGCVPKFPE